jgi:hypothetical protein
METRKGRRWGAAVFEGEEGGGVAARWCRRRTTTKSNVADREAEGGSWRLDVNDDQRKLGRWAECAVGLNGGLGRNCGLGR